MLLERSFVVPSRLLNHGRRRVPPKQKLHRLKDFIKIARMRVVPSFLMLGIAMPKLDLLHRLWPKTAAQSVGA